MTKKQQRSLWSQLPQWAWKQGLRTNVDFAQHPDSSAAPAASQRQLPEHSTDIKTAQVITSRVEYPESTDMHKPVLDIDFPAQLVPSTTPGHFHLYLDKELTQEKYFALLRALAAAGIIEPGYRDASIARGYTSVRLPWVRKEEQPEAPAPAATPAAPAPQEAPQDLGEALLANAAQQRREADLRRQQQADPVLRNLAAAYGAERLSPPWNPPITASRESWQALVEANRPPATGPLRSNIAPNPAGPLVRYDPATMSFTDGTSRVPASAMHEYESESTRNLSREIERGRVSGNDTTWRSLVTHHGSAIRTRPTSSDPTNPAYQSPRGARPRVSIMDEVRMDNSPDLRQRLMEEELRRARQQRDDYEAHHRRTPERPPSQSDTWSWVGEPADSNITVSWEEPTSDPLGDIIEAADRIRATPAAPPAAPPIADPQVPF